MKFIIISEKMAFDIAALRIYDGEFLKHLRWLDYRNIWHRIGRGSVAEKHFLKRENHHSFKFGASAAMLSKLGKLFYL